MQFKNNHINYAKLCLEKVFYTNFRFKIEGITIVNAPITDMGVYAPTIKCTIRSVEYNGAVVQKGNQYFK